MPRFVYLAKSLYILPKVCIRILCYHSISKKTIKKAIILLNSLSSSLLSWFIGYILSSWARPKAQGGARSFFSGFHSCRLATLPGSCSASQSNSAQLGPVGSRGPPASGPPSPCTPSRAPHPPQICKSAACGPVKRNRPMRCAVLGAPYIHSLPTCTLHRYPNLGKAKRLCRAAWRSDHPSFPLRS